MKVEEHHGKRKRKQENISVLYWFFMRNSWPPSSPWSFRTHFCWSFITRQYLYSERFLQLHVPCWMCNQFTFHHQFRIDTGRPKFEQKDRRYSFCLWILWIKNTNIPRQSTWKHRVLHGTCQQHGRNIKTRCSGSISNLLKRKDWSSIRRDRTPSFFTIYSQLVASRELFGWKLEKSYTKSIWITSTASEDFFETWLDEGIGFRSCSTSRHQPTNPTKP